MFEASSELASRHSMQTYDANHNQNTSNPFLPHTVKNANVHKYLYLLLRTKPIVPGQYDQEEFPENSRAAES